MPNIVHHYLNQLAGYTTYSPGSIRRWSHDHARHVIRGASVPSTWAIAWKNKNLSGKKIAPVCWTKFGEKFENGEYSFDDYHFFIYTNDQRDTYDTFVDKMGIKDYLIKQSRQPSYNINVDFGAPRLNWSIFKFEKEVQSVFNKYGYIQKEGDAPKIPPMPTLLAEMLEEENKQRARGVGFIDMTMFKNKDTSNEPEIFF